MNSVLNMRLNSLKNIPAPIHDLYGIRKIFLSNYLQSYIHTRLIEILIWEYYKRNDVCLYKLDHANSSEVNFDSSRRISILYDLTISKLNSFKVLIH